jgi:surfactin synthase thioesterase subunit
MIGERARLYGARLAGRESRISEPPATTLDTVVAELVEATARLPEGRVDLFGHCSGAIIAFEVARALRDVAAPALGQLIVVGQVAPRLFAEDAPNATDPRRYIPDDLHDDAEWMELLVPVMEADLRALARYRYRADAPLAVPITAIRAGRDPYLRDAELAAWSEETTGPFVRVRIDDADHLFSGDAWSSLGDEVLRALRTESRGGTAEEGRETVHGRVDEDIDDSQIWPPVPEPADRRHDVG